MAFKTKLPYDNRQIIQEVTLNTELSGATTFGTDYSGLTSGVDLDTSVITSTLTGITSTFSGNTTVTDIFFGDVRMVSASESLLPITSSNSGTTQTALGYEGVGLTYVDNNAVYSGYTGSTYDLTVTSIEEVATDTWTGETISNNITFLSGSSLDHQERLIWVDVKGITKTKKLILGELPDKHNELSKVLGRLPNGDVVEVDLTQLDTVYEGTYAELQTLIDNNNLIVGNTYILNDYKTIYQIENTNTSDIIEYHTILGPSSVWAYFGFPGIASTSLKNGDTVTITELPDGYGGSHYVGEVVTVIDYFNESYIRFSPTTNESGIVIKIENPRWENVSSNATITDLSGNTIMQSGGVLNTEVHNDLPYMDMTASENPSPKIEEIILTAIDVNKFSINAESLTYLGDTLLYYFEDNQIYDENNVLIGTRNGLIKKREAFDLNISVNKDWRTQRYRRWKVTDDWDNFILQKSLYEVNGANICTIVNIIGEGHKYIAPKVVNKDFYLDFYSSGNTNPFLSGETSAPTVEGSARFRGDIAAEYSKDIILPFSGITSAKDFHIFPIINEAPTFNTSNFKVAYLENSVFLTESQRYGDSSNHNIDSTGGIYNSTFMTGTILTSRGGSLSEVTAIDATEFDIGSNSYTNKVRFLNFGTISNNGFIVNCTFGGVRSGANDYISLVFDDSCGVYNSIFGAERNDDVYFSNLQANKLLSKIKYTGNSKISGNVYLTEIQCNNKYWGFDIGINTWYDLNPVKGKYGYLYTIDQDINNKRVTNFYGNKNLIHESSDNLNIVQLITKATLQ